MEVSKVMHIVTFRDKGQWSSCRHNDHHPHASSVCVWQPHPHVMEPILTILLIRLSQVFVWKWNKGAGAPDTWAAYCSVCDQITGFQALETRE